jgi:hypothetical protein
LIGPFYFITQDTIEGVSGFRIDSHTIKRGNLEVNTVISVPLGELTPCMCTRTYRVQTSLGKHVCEMLTSRAQLLELVGVDTFALGMKEEKRRRITTVIGCYPQVD